MRALLIPLLLLFVLWTSNKLIIFSNICVILITLPELLTSFLIWEFLIFWLVILLLLQGFVIGADTDDCDGSVDVNVECDGDGDGAGDCDGYTIDGADIANII